jgi:Phosphotransferase enzyme family
MKWLAECSAEAVREALRAVAPELSGYPVTVPGPAGKQDPVWHSGSVPVGEWFFVKFAWSRPAALRLAREIDAVLASPGPAVLVHGDLHGDNQVWEHDELRLVVDFETIGAAEPEYDLRTFPGPGMGPGVELLTALMRHYQQISGRQLSADRVMAWHLRTVLGDALWRSEAGIPLADRRTPPEWVDDLAARFTALAIHPEPPPAPSQR